MSPQPLGEWEFRWGDSPSGQDGQPLWLDEEDAEWQAIDFPSNPPGRKEHQNVWFRTVLPGGEWRDPVIYITSIDLIGQVYVGGELIYQYGEFDEQGRGDFAGWPWHMIELPDDFAGQTLHLRVFSYYTDIGLWGEVQLMDRIDGLKSVIQRSAKDLAVSAFSLVLAALAGIFVLIGPERRGFVGIALFASAAGLMLLAESPARQLLMEDALWWDTLRAGSYFTLPIAMGFLLAHWLDGTPERWMRRLWQLHLAYLIIAIGLVKAGVISLSLTFPTFDVLLVITLPLMLFLALTRLNRMTLQQQLIVASFALFAPVLLVSMLVAHGFVAWRPISLSIGTLGFSIAIAGISLWDYRNTQRRLASLNQNLEYQVAARTAELDELVVKLEGFSYEDPLTGLKNRRHFDELLAHETGRIEREGHPLALVLMDLDHFKQVNDRYGHEAGDQVLVQSATLLREHFRNADVVCRLGGEEFIAMLPGASAAQAQSRADAVVQALAQQRFVIDGTLLPPITISCGVASYPEHTDDPKTLVGLADEALYLAKHSGRNRSQVAKGDRGSS
ncbi:MAG: diguanylate cyclase [Halomonas sp.]|nr:diguanylate cyclase [Halomonas sp.]